MRGNGRPKGCFWRVRFFSAPVRFALKTPDNLKWEEKKQTLQNTLLDDRFSARRLLRSFGAPPMDLGRNFLRGVCCAASLGGRGGKAGADVFRRDLSSKIIWGALSCGFYKVSCLVLRLGWESLVGAFQTSGEIWWFSFLMSVESFGVFWGVV